MIGRGNAAVAILASTLALLACGSDGDRLGPDPADAGIDAAQDTSHGEASDGDAMLDVAADVAPECAPGDLDACPAPASSCQTASCSPLGKCTTENKPLGTADPELEQTPGDCLLLVCDGQGGTTTEPADDPPGPAAECETVTCDNGAKKVGSAPNGQPCSKGICWAGQCVASFCVNGVKDQQETDVDCGGGKCPACPDGSGCSVGSDCKSTVCALSQCAPPSCSDSVKNGLETDIDCGGTCPACAAGEDCKGASDCESKVCAQGSCAPPSCLDGVKNGNESDVDCGGTCQPCALGKGCSSAFDCSSKVCAGGSCAAPSCSDGVTNGGESDVDCGVPCPNKCANGQACAVDVGCGSGWCHAGLCTQPSCTDGFKNGTETDVDCGGGCAACSLAKACATTGDCAQSECYFGRCAYFRFALDAGRTYRTYGELYGVRHADFDLDGDRDVLQFGGSYKPGIGVSLNDGTGRFAQQISAYADSIRDVEVADMDGDGYPDAVAVVKDKFVVDDYGAVVVLINNKAGALLPGAPIAIPGAKRVALGDLDGDGDVDAVTTSKNKGVVLFNNLGQLGAPVAIDGGNVEVGLADTDLDGDLDVVAVSTESYGILKVLPNDGKGVLGPTKVTDFTGFGTSTSGAKAFALGDLTGDGYPEVVYNEEYETVILRNDGTGAYTAANAIAPPWDDGSTRREPHLFDFDHNGTLDLLYVWGGKLEWDPGVRVVLNAGNGKLVDNGTISTGQSCTELTIADFDGDCRSDFVLGFPLGYLTVLQRRADGTYPDPPHVSGGGHALTVADMNGDAKPDVVSVWGDGSPESFVQISLSSGGGLDAKPAYQTPGMTVDVATGDFDGDGDQDVATVSGIINSLRIRLNTGGALSGITTYATDSTPRGVAPGDFDGDGKLDLMVACEGPVPFAVGHIDFFKGKGDGTFSPKVVANANLVNPARLVAVDWAKDGKLGVAVLSELMGTVHKLTGSGKGTLAGETLLMGSNGPSRMAVADFDGDGVEDVAATLADPATPGVKVVGSKTNYTQSKIYSAGTEPQAIAAGDLNGDGRMDIAVSTLSTSSLGVLLNTGEAFAPVLEYALALEPKALAIADFDGDGRADVVGGNVLTLLENRSGVAPMTCDVCGNGSVNDPEVCDDGGVQAGDGCSPTCKLELGYACSGAPSACATICGDTLVVGSETCDDKNTSSGDGCSAGCQIETGWSCSGKPSVCRPICGDSVVLGSEVCDDGNQLDWDTCPSTCRHDLWSTGFGNPAGTDAAGGAVFTPAGDVLATATLEGLATIGGISLPAFGSNDVLAAKLDAQGKFLWAKRFGGSGDDRAIAVASDPQGNAVLTGHFFDTIDFGGGQLKSAGSWDVFVAKLAGNGQHVFSKRFGDSSQQEARAIAIDANGNIFVAGTFFGSIDFGGGPLQSTGVDIWIAKLDASGNHLWSKQFGSAGSDHVRALSVSAAGDVYAGGTFDGTIDFGDGPHTSLGATDLFLVKLSPAGNTHWSRAWGLGNSYESMMGVTTSSQGVAIAGGFFGSLSFGGPALVSKGGEDIFVVQLDASGNHVWSSSFGGIATDVAWGLAGHPDGRLAAPVRFSPPMTVGGTVHTGSSSPLWMMLKLAANGSVEWAQAYDTSAPTFASGDVFGRTLVTGVYSTELDFGGIPLLGGAQDVFVVEFAP